MTVQTRKGYYAVRPEYAVPVRGYEAPALALLDRSPRPDAFAIRLGALSFPRTNGPGSRPSSSRSRATPWPGSPNARAAPPVPSSRWWCASRTRGAREADRLSQEYSLQAAAGQGEAGPGRRRPLLPRGGPASRTLYTVDAVAYDAIAQTASTRTSTFEVPKASAGGLRLSSLMVVGRAEKLTKEEQDGKNPLHYGEVMLYPNLGTSIRKSVAPVLGFFFSAYGKGAGPGQRATLEIQQGTKVLAKTSTELGGGRCAGPVAERGRVALEQPGLRAPTP